MLFRKVLLICLVVVCLGFLVSPELVSAATTKLTNPLGTTSIPELMGRIIKAVLGIVGSIALLMFIYGGFTWLTAAGSPEKVKKGMGILTWATIGLVVIFVSYISVNFVINTLTERGVEGEKPSFKDAPEDFMEWCRDHPDDSDCLSVTVGRCTSSERTRGGRCMDDGSRIPYHTTSAACRSAGYSWESCD